MSRKHNGDKVIVFDRGGTAETTLVFAFNFHPSRSFCDYRLGVPFAGEWRPVFTTDAAEFGGHARVDPSVNHIADEGEFDGRPASIMAYLPSRSAVVFAHTSSGFEGLVWEA